MSQSLQRAHRPRPREDSSKSIQDFLLQHLHFKAPSKLCCSDSHSHCNVRRFFSQTYMHISDLPVRVMTFKSPGAGQQWLHLPLFYPEHIPPLNLVTTAQYFQLSNTRPTAGVTTSSSPDPVNMHVGWLVKGGVDSDEALLNVPRQQQTSVFILASFLITIQSCATLNYHSVSTPCGRLRCQCRVTRPNLAVCWTLQRSARLD